MEKAVRVAVIGDVIIDRYIYGTAERLSPEAPIPIVKQLHTKETLGGAGNLYENLISIGVDADLFDLAEDKCIKTRVFCDSHYVSRIDNDIIADGEEIYSTIKNIDFSPYEYVILSDYNKGVLTRSNDIINYINSFGCKVIVDPKKSYHEYKGAWLIKPNQKEYVDYILGYTGNAIVTQADDQVLAEIDGKTYSIVPNKVSVADVTGAGDCFLAAFVYGLVNNYDHRKCLEIATDAATESVKHLGTYVLKPEDMEHKVVFTNGCFDIIHRGHIDYLEQSKKLGHRLIVGLNSDASVKRLKGESRPINNEDDRWKALRALKCVDDVYIFEEDTPYNLIRKIQPDIITKGGDYKPEDVIGNDLAKVVILPYTENYSTTNIVSKLND
jgi:D-beta-D-heptose 7-phosphate kinase/D-beta-D-heptose 1-phosphate adenosyltransferase